MLPLVAALLLGLPAPAGALPPLPAGWPTTLQLGMKDPPGGAAALRATTSFGFRYQYLAGGVNTGDGWATWNADGAFVTNYSEDSITHGLIPVFSYYTLVQSAPGNAEAEGTGVFTNLQNAATMAAYYADLRLFFQRAGAFPAQLVVLHVEPDLWGYMQQRATADDARSVPAKVSSTGVPELAGLPDDFSGFARAIVRLRDAYAPNVRLAYHLSVWGTGVDIAYSNPPDETVVSLATRAADFYRSLQAGFDLVFGEFKDRDAGFYEHVRNDGGASWWDAGDFARYVRFLETFVAASGRRVVLWQIPLGNTRMRAMNNTWNHYQDNRVEWLLDDPTRAHLTDYVRAGVMAFLFGRGANGATCACDAAGDGVTNPPPINGNTELSLSADDDGGFFRQKAAAYYAAGALALDLVSATVDKAIYSTGDTLAASVGVNNPGIPVVVDFYLGVLLPDGDTVVFFTKGGAGVALGRASSVASFQPVAVGISLATPFAVTVPNFFTHTWTGGEPPGSYLFFIAAVLSGALADGSIDPGDVVASSPASFAFAP